MARRSMVATRRRLVEQYLTELSLLVQQQCPEACVEATTECFEDEDGHLRIYPPPEASEAETSALEARIAGRCVDMLVEEGILICTAVYD